MHYCWWLSAHPFLLSFTWSSGLLTEEFFIGSYWNKVGCLVEGIMKEVVPVAYPLHGRAHSSFGWTEVDENVSLFTVGSWNVIGYCVDRLTESWIVWIECHWIKNIMPTITCISNQGPLSDPVPCYPSVMVSLFCHLVQSESLGREKFSWRIALIRLACWHVHGNWCSRSRPTVGDVILRQIGLNFHTSWWMHKVPPVPDIYTDYVSSVLVITAKIKALDWAELSSLQGMQSWQMT